MLAAQSQGQSVLGQRHGDFCMAPAVGAALLPSLREPLVRPLLEMQGAHPKTFWSAGRAWPLLLGWLNSWPPPSETLLQGLFTPYPLDLNLKIEEKKR